MSTFTYRLVLMLMAGLVLILPACTHSQAAEIAETETASVEALSRQSTATFTATRPRPTSTRTPRPTYTPIRIKIVVTATPSATPTPTPLPTRRPTVTPTLSMVISPVSPILPTATGTPSPTPSLTASPTSTFTQALPPTPVTAGITALVPILMYHFISVPPSNADIYRQDLSVTPQNFEAQLAYLQEQGYTTISLNDLTHHLAGLQPLPNRPVILSFDDGYADNYSNAFPLLQKHGFTATFSLVTQPIDFGDPNYLSWDNVIEMHAAGMEFGAHTYRHLDLRDRDVDFLVYEIVGSKEAIEARINEPVRYFVYPAGQYDQLVIDVLASADFWGALTTQYGYEHSHASRFEMPRVRISGADTLETFITKLEAVQ